MVTGERCSNIRSIMPQGGINLFSQLANTGQEGPEDNSEIEADSVPAVSEPTFPQNSRVNNEQTIYPGSTAGSVRQNNSSPVTQPAVPSPRVQNPPAISGPDEPNSLPASSQQNLPAGEPESTSQQRQNPSYQQLGIITERPKRTEYAPKAARFRSFESWPSGHHLKKEDLADAGFYFAGKLFIFVC